MKVIKEISSMQDISDYHRFSGNKLALVPTMGFLHSGHTSLMIKAKDENDISVVSIFVNPTQFGKNEDFGKYPRDFDRDYHICEKAGADYIFYPDVDEMYGKNNLTNIVVSGITEKLEGSLRPGHFTGVATVVTKLLNAVKPDSLYLGQKDAQQNCVIKKMINDLNIDVNLIICPTVRESNGLAMSSRNTYLTDDQKNKASVIFYLLNEGKRLIIEDKITNKEIITGKIIELFRSRTPEFELQYYEINDNDTLETIEDINNFSGEILISIAVKAGSTRLIDNIIFHKQLYHSDYFQSD